jgi:hypothetical protein
MLYEVSLEQLHQYRGILDTLYEFRGWVLGFSALCGLVALSGGGIKIRDIEIPRASSWARVASLMTCLACLVVVVLIRPPESQKTKPLSGQIIFSGRPPERIKLELWPVDSIGSREFTPGVGIAAQSFTFNKPIEDGSYLLKIFEGSERKPLDEIHVQIAPDKPLVLSQKADGRFQTGYEQSVVDHLVNKYKELRDWREQVVAIEQLSDLANRDRDGKVKKALRDMVRGSDPKESILAAFSLSHNCVGGHDDEATKRKLKEVWEEHSNRYNQIRARAAQQCDRSEWQGIESDLLEIVRGQAVLLREVPMPKQRGLKATAAYFLATMPRAAPRDCVVDILIAALGSSKAAQDRAYQGLKTVTGMRTLPPNKADWESWWSGSKSNYHPCEAAS